MSEDNAGWEDQSVSREKRALFNKMDRGTSRHLSLDFSQVRDKALGGSEQSSPSRGDYELQRLRSGNKPGKPEESQTCL